MDEKEQLSGSVPDTALPEMIDSYFRTKKPDERFLSCPTEEVLCNYLGDRLPQDEREDLEWHLCQCEACLQAVMLSAQLPEHDAEGFSAEAPRFALQRLLSLVPAAQKQSFSMRWERFKAACMSFMKACSEIIFFREPEAVYVRGNKKIISKNLVVLEKIFKDIQLEIEVEKIGEQMANIKVKTSSPETGSRVDGLRVNIRDDAHREIASFMTAGGEALFENIAFGEYTISVKKNGNNVGNLLLAVKES